MSKVIIISGASSGFGALSARALADASHIVYAGMRDIGGRNAAQANMANEYAREHHVELRSVELDVSSQSSADQAIATVLKDTGRIDVVIHNAGHMVTGPTEAFTPEEIASVYDTNVLGTQRLNRAALPVLRTQKRACCCGSAAPALAAAPHPTWPRTLRPRPRWTLWRSVMQVRSPDSVSSRPSWFLARSPRAPTISPTAGARRIST